MSCTRCTAKRERAGTPSLLVTRAGMLRKACRGSGEECLLCTSCIIACHYPAAAADVILPHITARRHVRRSGSGGDMLHLTNIWFVAITQQQWPILPTARGRTRTKPTTAVDAARLQRGVTNLTLAAETNTKTQIAKSNRQTCKRCLFSTRLLRVRGHSCFKRDAAPRAILLTNAYVNRLFSTHLHSCLLYTSPSPRDQRGSRMPSSA